MERFKKKFCYANWVLAVLVSSPLMCMDDRRLRGDDLELAIALSQVDQLNQDEAVAFRMHCQLNQRATAHTVHGPAHHTPRARTNESTASDAAIAYELHQQLNKGKSAELPQKRPSTAGDATLARQLQQQLNSGQGGDQSHSKHESTKSIRITADGGLLPAGNLSKLFPKIDIYNFKTSGQKGLQCGPRSIANALGIQDIIQSGADVISPAQQRVAASKYTFSGERIENINMVQVLHLANSNGLEHAFVLTKNPQDTRECLLNATIREMHWIEYDQICRLKYNNRERYVAHIICNTSADAVKDSHWIAMSVIKEPHKKPILIIMDTMNRQFHNDSIVVEFVRFLYNTCLTD